VLGAQSYKTIPPLPQRFVKARWRCGVVYVWWLLALAMSSDDVQTSDAALPDDVQTSDTALPLPAPDVPVPEGCRVVLLSPLDIHFSQMRVRAEFQDGRPILESLAEVKAIPLASGASDAEEADMDGISSYFCRGTGTSSASTSADGGETDDGDSVVSKDVSEAKESLLLCLPFPRIEVTRWRCKLREADGTPRIDEATGMELYSEEERWFTFDNRRLCCLQRAAIASWPAKVFCEVIEVPQPLAKQRELRKFDTKTFGLSLTIGRRDDPNPEPWCWRSAAGLPPEEQPDSGVARQRSLRWRGGRAGGGQRGDNGDRRRYGRNKDKGEAESGGTDVVRSVLLFFLIYLALRIVVLALKHRTKGDGTVASPPVANDSLGMKLVYGIVDLFNSMRGGMNAATTPAT